MSIKGDRAFWEAQDEGLAFINATIGELLAKQAAAMPEKEAVVYNYPEINLNLRLNYRQYQNEVNRVAKALLALGIAKGEHVAVWATNVPEWLFLQMALARIGAVMITVNTAYRTSEIEYVLKQGDATHLFMIDGFRGNSYAGSMHELIPELEEIADPIHQILQATKLPCLKRIVLMGDSSQPGMLSYADFLQLSETVPDEVLESRASSVTPHDTAMIMYTSGTTGFPKGAMLSHFGIINTLRMLMRDKDFSHERYVNPMPFFHVAGGNYNISAILTGCTNIPIIAFDPIKVLEVLATEKGTNSFLVPTMQIAMWSQPRFLAGEFELSSWKNVYTGGTSIPVAIIEQAKAKFGVDTTIVFGQTESAGCGTYTRDDDSPELKSETVGKAYPHVAAKIVQPATGEVLDFDTPGELLMKGFPVMASYYNMPEKTADTIDVDGWLHTGDLATMDAQGYIKIVGRVKDMVIRGGENIYPAEIEAFLLRHPKVADVQVVGVPDEYMGEEIAALIRLKAEQETTAEELREYCRANISRYKVPKYFKFVGEFPLTASGKVKKYELRTALIAELDLQKTK